MNILIRHSWRHILHCAVVIEIMIYHEMNIYHEIRMEDNRNACSI